MSKEQNFKQKLSEQELKLKNVPNMRCEDGVFSFSDYVDKNIYNWMMVPDIEEGKEEETAREAAEKMYKVYEELDDLDEVSVEREDDDMYWCTVEVNIPDDEERREEVAERLGEAIKERRKL